MSIVDEALLEYSEQVVMTMGTVLIIYNMGLRYLLIMNHTIHRQWGHRSDVKYSVKTGMD